MRKFTLPEFFKIVSFTLPVTPANTALVRSKFSLFVLPFLFLVFIGDVYGQGAQTENVAVELIAETQTAIVGKKLWVALRISHNKGWHTYWKNPGDAGQPTKINWQLPNGVTVGDVVWPVPERLVWPIGLVDFGYVDEIFLLNELSIANSFQGETLQLAGNVKWLECDDKICLQKEALVQLSLPVSKASTSVVNQSKNQDWVEGFAQTRASIPREDILLDSTFTVAEGKIHLLIQATEAIFSDAQAIRFFPGQHRVFDYNAEQDVASQLSSLQLSQVHHQKLLTEIPDKLSGVLLVTNTQNEKLAYQINAQLDGINLAELGVALPAVSNRFSMTSMSVFVVFTYALLGGLVLNFMPCVFPILSLKVLSLVENSAANASQQRRHGLAYTAGVIVAFVILALVFLGLQAGGALIGWGFQLQTPWFVAALALVFFILALGMSSVVEIGSGIMGLGSNLTDQDGYAGSFYTGLLACVVGSPCTTPFIGPALAFALTQNMFITLAVFIVLGLGMAAPFLLFSFVPAMAGVLPKPGKWMLTFKKLLAVPLYATVVWLFWVLDKQISRAGLVAMVGACLLVGLAAWFYQGIRQSTQENLSGTNRVRTIMIACSLVLVIGVFFSPLLHQQTRPELVYENGIEAYSDARLAQLRSENKAVFVNMTASWCITCLVNEKVALSSEALLETMVKENVVYLKGDWTNNDPEITAVLKRYQTSGVPLYLMFPANSAEPAQVLPQILTESIMLEAIKSASVI